MHLYFHHYDAYYKYIKLKQIGLNHSFKLPSQCTGESMQFASFYWPIYRRRNNRDLILPNTLKKSRHTCNRAKKAMQNVEKRRRNAKVKKRRKNLLRKF